MSQTPPGRTNGSQKTHEYPSTSSATAPRDDTVALSGECLERFTRTFETSARRWELVVYPAMFAFIVLAAYGFFLIYSLTQDVSSVARSVDRMTVSVTAMSDHMGTVSNRMQSVSLNMDSISHKMDNLGPMRTSMESIDKSTQFMSATTGAIRQDMTGMNMHMAKMNQGIRPMRKLANFMPW